MIKCNFYFFSNRDSFLREMCVLFNLLYFKYYQNQGFFLNLLMHLLMQELFGLKVRGNLSCIDIQFFLEEWDATAGLNSW